MNSQTTEVLLKSFKYLCIHVAIVVASFIQAQTIKLVV